MDGTSNSFELLLSEDECSALEESCESFSYAMELLDTRLDIILYNVSSIDSNFTDYLNGVEALETVDKESVLGSITDPDGTYYQSLALEISFDDFVSSYMERVSVDSSAFCVPFSLPQIILDLSDGAGNILDLSGISYKTIYGIRYAYYLVEIIRLWAEDVDESQEPSDGDLAELISETQENYDQVVDLYGLADDSEEEENDSVEEEAAFSDSNGRFLQKGVLTLVKEKLRRRLDIRQSPKGTSQRVLELEGSYAFQRISQNYSGKITSGDSSFYNPGDVQSASGISVEFGFILFSYFNEVSQVLLVFWVLFLP